MANTGFKVNEECKTLYEEFKMSGTKLPKYDYIVLVPDGDKGVVIVGDSPPYGESAGMDDYKDSTNEPPSFKRLRNYLKTKSAAYCFYDFRWVQADGASEQSKTEIKFIAWSDDNKATGREKMIFAGTKDAVKKALKHDNKDHSANDESDLVYKDILADLSKGKKIVTPFSRD